MANHIDSKNNIKTTMECSICLTAVLQEQKKTTACKHTFHKACLDEWTKAHNTCPLCRQIIEHAPRIFPWHGPPGFLPPMSAPLSSWFSREEHRLALPQVAMPIAFVQFALHPEEYQPSGTAH